MKDEIKEILEYMKKVANKNEEDYESKLSHRDCALLLDYITNLQEENKKLEEDNYELEKYINEEEGFVKDENRELGLRIDKAVEYNNKNIHSQTLNNILQGDDNE